MKKILSLLFLSMSISANAHVQLWQQADVQPDTKLQVVHPVKYRTYVLQVQFLKNELFSLPASFDHARTLSFPMPDGHMRQFKVWQTPMFEPVLAAQFPDIRTFTAVAVDDASVTAKLDITELGFHAMVFDGDKTYFIDPYSNPANNYYLCYYKNDILSMRDGHCGVANNTSIQEISKEASVTVGNSTTPLQWKQSGSFKNTYRLAVACTGEYSVAVAGSATPTKAISLSAITTSVNRVNGVYEREVGIHMNLVANEADVIYLDGTTDPYNNNDAGGMQTQNQTNLNSVIGLLNYDIGHVFCTSVSSIAQLGCVCSAAQKAMGVTGQPNPTGAAFDIDFVAHEMGHQFGATHTFNANTSSCGGNGASNSAYEPGSGSTIMAYAGICGSANNLQAHSDDYFHAKSLDQITNFITTAGASCASISASGNTPPVLPAMGQTYNVPQLTPFELTAPTAFDTDHDVLNYCWEEYDLGDYAVSFSDAKLGPIFRSYNPALSATRIFPHLDSLRKNVKWYIGEKLSDQNRTLTFKVTARDMLSGYGSFDISGDDVSLQVTTSSGPFKVIYPNLITDYMQSGSSATITWDVANTTASPVSCSNVDIMLSTDDGLTFPITLASNTPNDGNEVVNVPSGIYAGGCRVKIKGVGNVFFDMSDEHFSVFPWPASVSCIENADKCFSVYPVPAKDILHIDSKTPGSYQLVITNTLGQKVWVGELAQQIVINTNAWASGIYNIHFADKEKNTTYTRKVVINN